MNCELSDSDLPEGPVITREGRFFRVNVLRRNRVESYLCETEAEARRFADLLAQPPLESSPTRRGTRPAQPASAEREGQLRIVRSNVLNWKLKP